MNDVLNVVAFAIRLDPPARDPAHHAWVELSMIVIAANSASVSASAGAARRRTNVSRASSSAGRASAARPRARVDRPRPSRLNACSGTKPNPAQRLIASL